jgi:hypothetical protein
VYIDTDIKRLVVRLLRRSREKKMGGTENRTDVIRPKPTMT